MSLGMLFQSQEMYWSSQRPQSSKIGQWNPTYNSYREDHFSFHCLSQFEVHMRIFSKNRHEYDNWQVSNTVLKILLYSSNNCLSYCMLDFIFTSVGINKLFYSTWNMFEFKALSHVHPNLPITVVFSNLAGLRILIFCKWWNLLLVYHKSIEFPK